VGAWLKDLVTNISDDIPILLVGNKLDLDAKHMRQGIVSTKKFPLFFVDVRARVVFWIF
jgi:GTPase SAR1 family protein